MNASPIRLDASPSIVVIACTEHPWWRAMRFTKEDAWEVACSHEEREHEGDYRQRKARDQRARDAATRREFVGSGNSPER